MANANCISELLHTRIGDAGGSLPWADFMRMALYEPGLGYYRRGVRRIGRGVRRIGRGGDFYTSVSVGPLFGELLAAFAGKVWRALGAPGGFAIIEQGAHDGTLAGDVLGALRRHEAGMFESVRYVIVEPDDALRAAQRTTLGDLGAKLNHAGSWEELREAPEHALFLCNELPDAMPVHRVRLTAGGWRELHVQTGAAGGFEFVPKPVTSDELARELEIIGTGFADGYETEVNLAMLHWLREMAAAKFCGAALILDYGMSAAEYYAPERSSGTLRRYAQHRSDDRVLEDPGNCDLTAHVNFTRLVQEAQSLAMPVFEFIEQGRFLTRLAADQVSKDSTARGPAWLRQFQSLTHPGIMGRSFQALALAKGLEASRFAAEDQIAGAMRRIGF